MLQGELTELAAAIIIAIALFLIFLVIGGPLVGLGAGLLVIGAYLGYVAQFLTSPIRRSS